MVVSYFWQHKGWRQFGKVEASFLNNWNPFHSPQILWLYLDATIKVFLESRNEFSFFFFLTLKISAGAIFFAVYSTLAQETYTQESGESLNDQKMPEQTHSVSVMRDT